MKKENVLFILHRLYFDGKTKEGGIDFFIRFFRAKDNSVFLIEHPLEVMSYSSKLIVDGETKKEYLLKEKPPLRWIKEFFLNQRIIKNLGIRFKYAYASDALNFISLYFLKRKGLIDKVLFHCTDFSKNRFKNPVLNWIYLSIFRFSLKHATMTNVVTPYVEKMAKLEVPGANIKFVPNSPVFATFPRIEPDSKDRYKLVITISQMSKKSNFDNYLEIIKLVKTEIPDIKLQIVGSVDDYAKDLIKKNKMEKNILYTGLLPYEKSIKELASGYIGIVFYPENIDHVKYGDSIKIREYAAAGIPTVSDGITSTAYEMEKAGAGLIGKNPSEMAKNIILLIKDKKLYGKMRTDALSWAKKMDKEKLLDDLYNEFSR